MSPAILRRFVLYLAILTVAGFVFWQIVGGIVARPPGDYHTETGGNRLQDGLYQEALDAFASALGEMPGHRGALMGRAIALMQLQRFDEAETALTNLINRLDSVLGSDDATGIGVLAAAHANRGILHDRAGRHEKALADYRIALRIDSEAVAGPGVVDKILRNTPRPATVKNRAAYLQRQLALPVDQRLLRVPEIDDRQRMHKP